MEEAEQMQREALVRRETSLGPRHPEVLNSVRRLGDLLDRLGAEEEAGELFQRELEGLEEVYGPSHQKTLKRREELATLGGSTARGSGESGVLVIRIRRYPDLLSSRAEL